MMIFDTEKMVRFDADTGATGGAATDDTATGADNTGDTSKEGDVGNAGQEPNSGKLFSQAEVDRMIQDRLRRATEKAELERKKAEDKAKEDEAKKQGEYQRLWEEEKQKREEAEAVARRLEVESIKARVAKSHNIPERLVDRLRGETEEEIAEDAKSLAETLPKPGVDVNAQSGTGNSNQAPTMTDAQKVEFAARFGVKPEFVNPEYMKVPK